MGCHACKSRYSTGYLSFHTKSRYSTGYLSFHTAAPSLMDFFRTDAVAFTKTRNGTERKKDGTGGTLRNRLLWNTEQRRNKQNAKRRNRRNETEQNITEYGTQTEHSDCKWSERYGTQLYDNTEHGTHLRNAIITVRNVKGC